MTLKKIGTVTITEDRVLAEHFFIIGGDMTVTAAMEILQWTQGRLTEAIAEEKAAAWRGQTAT